MSMFFPRLEFWAFLFFLVVLILYTITMIIQTKNKKRINNSEEPNYITEIKKVLKDINDKLP